MPAAISAAEQYDRDSNQVPLHERKAKGAMETLTAPEPLSVTVQSSRKADSR